MRECNTAGRRARLREVLSREGETEAFLRIFRRQRVAYVAAARRQAQRAEEAKWITIERALEIQGTDEPARLLTEIKNKLPCRFWGVRWWQHKPMTQAVRDIADIQENRLVDRHGASLETDQWKFQISEKYWRERLGLVGTSAHPVAPPQAKTSALAGAAPTPAPPQTASLARPIGEKGGRPSDKDRVVAEAKRRIANAATEPLPQTLAEFAVQLHAWLDQQPGAYRLKKTGNVMSLDTIEGHVRPIWKTIREGF